jgi:hypothetical protein
MSNYNQNSGYGQALLNMVASQVPTFGRIFIVMNSSNTDEENYTRIQDVFPPDPQGQVRFFTSLSDAYDATESNNNDVILLDANSTHELSAGLAITKNRVHFIGMDGGGRLVQQGAKVQLVTAATTAYVIKNTGTRNTFRNIKFIQAGTAATCLHVLEEGGEGTLAMNCSFTFGVQDNLDLTTAIEVVFGGDSDTFIKCQFGQDTLLSSATTRSIMKFDQVNGFAAKSNVFEDCAWIGASSDADLLCISMVAAGDILFSNHLIRPTLIASISGGQGAIACTRAVSTANGLTNGTLLISYPMCHGFTDIGTNGTNNDQLLVAGPVLTAVDHVGVAPVAT